MDEERNAVMNPILEDMYNITCLPCMEYGELMKDSMFKAACESLQKISSEHLVKNPRLEFSITQLDQYRGTGRKNDAFGCIYILGDVIDLNGEPFKLLEQRILGLRTYNLFIIIGPEDYDIRKNIIPINIKDINTSKISLRVDALSRTLDYLIDCYYDDQSKSTALHARENQVTNDPVISIAKTILLYADMMRNTPIKKYIEAIEKQDQESDQKDLLWFNLIDSILTNHMRTDWLPLSSFKSNDKLQCFQHQIGAKEDIYNLARDVYSEDLNKFDRNYKNLFTGDIYKLAGYPNIESLLFAGMPALSTETLNMVWRQYC